MKFVPKAVTRAAGMSALKFKAKSPTILVVAGVVGFGATAVMAARASRAAEPVLDNHAKNRMQLAETATSEELERKQVINLYMETAGQLARVYGPTIAVGTISAASVLYGHKLLQRRHVATLLAYSGLQDQFLAYRNRIARTLGEDAERDIYNGAHGEWLEDPDHKGEYKLAPVFEDDGSSNFLRPWIDEANNNCFVDPNRTRMFLDGAQNHMNNLLQARGYLFLNEVLGALGLSQVPEGQVAGWLLNGDGDNTVDFGYSSLSNDPNTIDFVQGRSRTVQLNFNVDGNIYAEMLARGMRTFY